MRTQTQYLPLFQARHALANFHFKRFRRWMGVGALLAGLMTITPSGRAAQKLWSGAGGDTLWSTAGNWSPAGAPGVSDNVVFTNDAVSDNTFTLGGAVNNIVDSAFLAPSINSLAYMNTNGFHNTLLTNLNVFGNSATDVAVTADDGLPYVLFIGSNRWQDGKDDSVYTSIIGGSLNVSNVNANFGVTQISATSGAHRATLDLANLDSFSCVVSNVMVGQNFTQPDHAWRPTGELLLAKTNSITTKLIVVSDSYQNAGAACFIHLGSVNTINSDEIRIGMHKCVGSIDIGLVAVNPQVTLRNAAGTGRQISWELGDEFDTNTNYLFGFFTSNQARGTMDLTGATVDALVDQIILGRGQIQRDATVRNGDGNGTLIFGGGIIDVNQIQMGIQVPGPFIGGSIGNGILTVNNDAGVGPALLNVRSNIVMAVQQPGNTDVVGSTAVITVSDGSTAAVAGDILGGTGTSTINLNNGGKLDMKPSGDSTAGNVSINILNVTDEGIITNYGILSLTNITLAGSSSQFTVYAGQSLAPARVGVAGLLSVTGNLILRGNMLMDISKVDTTLSSDAVDATAGVDLGGTVTVSFSGNTNLVLGDKFTLFNAVPVNSSPTVILPPPGAGLAWNNKIFVDGTIEVVSCGCGEPTTAPTLSVSNSPTSITLSWPAAYTSFVLRGQTNPITLGLSGNWGAVSGVSGNQVTIPIDPANGTVFFRLFQQ